MTRPSAWRSLKTVPRDGTRVIVWLPAQDKPYFARVVRQGILVEGLSGYYSLDAFTHWRPAPGRPR